jgi:hypothetical protein
LAVPATRPVTVTVTTRLLAESRPPSPSLLLASLTVRVPVAGVTVQWNEDPRLSE